MIEIRLVDPWDGRCDIPAPFNTIDYCYRTAFAPILEAFFILHSLHRIRRFDYSRCVPCHSRRTWGGDHRHQRRRCLRLVPKGPNSAGVDINHSGVPNSTLVNSDFEIKPFAVYFKTVLE